MLHFLCIALDDYTHGSYGHGKSWNFSKSLKMERVMEF